MFKFLMTCNSMYCARNALKYSVKTIKFRKCLAMSSCGLLLAHCEGLPTSKEEKQEQLTHEHCIKQACVMTVNSSSTLLTTTASAILDVCQKYTESLANLVGLLEQSLLLDGESAEFWDPIVEARLDVNKAKAALTELSTYMESVEKLVNSTTEAAFLAGADYMCTVLCERLYSVQKEINEHITEIKKLEEDYLRIQQEIIKNSNKKKEQAISEGVLLKQEQEQKL